MVEASDHWHIDPIKLRVLNKSNDTILKIYMSPVVRSPASSLWSS